MSNAFNSVRPRGPDVPESKRIVGRGDRQSYGKAMDVNGRPVVSLERRGNSITISSREQSAAQLARSKKISLRAV